MSNEHKPLISATTEEDFRTLREKIKELPECVYRKIKGVSNSLVGIECEYEKTFDIGAKIMLPKTCEQIQRFENYIGCYCGDFFIKIPLQDKNDHYNYIFV